MANDREVNNEIKVYESDGYLMIDNDRVIDCSTRFLELMGCSSEKDITGCRFYELSPQLQPNGRSSLEQYREMVEEVYSSGRSSCSYQFLSRSQDAVNTDLTFTVQHIDGKEVIGAIVRVISEKDRSRRISHQKMGRLRQSLFESIFFNSPEAIAILDNEFCFVSVNSSFEELFQYHIDEIKYQNATKVLCEEEFYDESTYFKDCIKRGEFVRRETLRRRKDGTLVYVSFLGYPLFFDGEQVGVCGMYTDLNNFGESRIELLTSKDSLTGLYNREYFISKLNYEVSRRNRLTDKDKEFAIIFLDLDDFKEINDNMGHLAGDSVLKEFASRLKGSVREYDIAARFGGDEFIVLILYVKGHFEIAHIANRIVEETSKPFMIDNIEMQITASLGISRYPEDGTDSTTLIRNADIAMYRSKEGKNKKVTMFEPSLDEELKEYFKIKNNLRNAVANNELFLEYQPIFDVNREKVVGAEALVRWSPDASELIPPLKFIPIAEKNGYMQSIGEWVLRTACLQNRIWQDSGFDPIFISVNISVIQLEQTNFCELVRKVLEDSKLNPKYLQLEITETIFNKNYERIVETIRQINRLGVKVSIDDFGTGFSSLGQLSRLEITNLKIDKAFISGINENENQNRIVRAIISLAESLNLELIAEGVETREQLDFLSKYECNMVQGYLYSKPVLARDIERLL
jgi:diguanylate cyclase (GGDEF)-like protein/PAS domain S-box-containing protein